MVTKKDTRTPKNYWTLDRCKEEALKYINRKELRENNKSVYNKACSEGWLDDICSHMKKSSWNKKWNYKKCNEESLKYKTRSEYQKNSGSSYQLALKNGWLDEVCSHMERKHEQWTYDKVKKEAIKYESKTKFIRNVSGAYQAAKRNGWYEDVCSHMKPQSSLKDRYIYVYEFPKTNSVYVGLTYNTKIRNRQHMSRKDSMVYRYMKENNLSEQDYIFKVIGYYKFSEAQSKETEYENKYISEGWNIINIAPTGNLGGGRTIYTYKKVKERIKKYKTKMELYREDYAYYNAARRNGWLKEFCSHMVDGIQLSADKKRKWTYEKCKEEAKKYDRLIDFRKNSGSVYNSAKKYGWFEEITSHMEKQNEWTYKNCQKEAKKYKTKTEFQKKNGSAYQSSLKNGWLDDVCSHMEVLWDRKWTSYNKVKKEALKYNTKTEFQKNARGAYKAAIRNGWLDDVCSHMEVLWCKKWTSYEKIKYEALKYKTRTEFNKNEGGAYNAAKRNGWLDEFFPIS